MANIAETVYKGSASYGRFIAIVFAVLSILIGIGLIIAGITYNKSVLNYSSTTLGTINSKKCDTYDKNKNCNYIVSFVDDNGQTINAQYSSKYEYEINSKIDIVYDPSDKNSIRLKSDNTKTFGYAMIGIGIIIPMFAWIWVWVTRKYEFAASASGFSSVFNMFKN